MKTIALCIIETETRNKSSYKEIPSVCHTLEPLTSGNNNSIRVSHGVTTSKNVLDVWINNPLYVTKHRTIMPLNVDVKSTLYEQIGGNNYLQVASTSDRVEELTPRS